MILIRCDANEQWGMGHLTRCRALAYALHDLGIAVSMVGPSKEWMQPEDAAIFSHWHPMAWQDDQAAGVQQCLELAQHWQAVGLVLDEPRADETCQKALFKSGLPWLQFDGTAQKPLWASAVLNALPDANASAYARVLQNPQATLLLGPQYAVLRSEFETAHRADKKAEPFKILLTLGGGDDRGALAWCLKALLPMLDENICLQVISGRANPRNMENLEWVRKTNSPWIDYAIQPTAPWMLMSQCHMAVMASGTTAHEANFCRLPMVLVSVVEDQHKPGLAWQQAGQAQYLGPWESVSESTLQNSVAQCRQAIRSSTTDVQTLVDGRGASRVAQAIINLIHVKSNAAIQLS
jgi:spore coat polysaccharide biosynthesis predicted glycosyltransferase SpsG